MISLAGGILFLIWVLIVIVVIGHWVVMTLTKQEKSLYFNRGEVIQDITGIKLTEEDRDNIL